MKTVRERLKEWPPLLALVHTTHGAKSFVDSPVRYFKREASAKKAKGKKGKR